MEKGEVAVLLNEDNTLGDVSAPSTSTSLETLQFKHDFFEVLEELQLRRQQDEEHKRRLQEILKEKYELEKKLEDSCMVNSQLVEEHKTEQEEIRHCYEEKMRTLQEEKTKASINSSCEDGQVSRLKDEIRALHLHKYNLEKTVSEQEHKLHLQTSSHEQFLSLVRQLEEKCTTLSQQVIHVNEHLDLLSNNVNEAIVINAKLEKQQKHHDCVVFSYQDELTSTKKELLKLTTKLSIDEQEDKMVTGGSSNIKDLEQQLKMQWDTTALLEKQMEELQKENSSIACALKESSSLLEQQVDSYEQTKSKNTSLQEQLTATKNHSEAISIELAEKSNDLTQLEKKHQQQEEIHSKKFADMEQRLRALQSDFMALQQSYESLQYDKQQWLKEKAEYTTTVGDKTEKITLLEGQLKKQLSDLNPKPIVSTSKSPDLIKVVSVEITEDNSKRKCTEDDLPNNKRTCLSPSIISPSPTELPSSIHDSPAMPIPSSSHDPSVVSPPSISGDLPVKLLNTSSHEHPDSPLHSSLKDPSPPSSHDLLTTPPSLHVSTIQSSPVDSSHLASHDPTATPPHVCDASIKPDTSSHDTMPSCLDRRDLSQPHAHNSPTGLSSNSPVTTKQDQLEFSDLTSDIINTQLNQQIIEVQHFLKSDRLKRTKLPDTNTIQQ